MRKYILKRLLEFILFSICLSFLTFLILELIPGDAAMARLSASGIALSNETLNQMRIEMGLDKPFLLRFINWFLGVICGDFGTSIENMQPVLPQVLDAFGITLSISFITILIFALLAFLLCILNIAMRSKIFDKIIKELSFAGNSVPSFILGIIIMYIFCIKLKIFSVIYKGDKSFFIQPILTLGIPIFCRFLLQFRTEILHEYGKEYVTELKLRGVKEIYIFKYIIKGSFPSILICVISAFSPLLGGSVVVENIFGYNGAGALMMDAITAKDYPIILCFVLISSLFVCMINLLADVIYMAFNKRIIADFV